MKRIVSLLLAAALATMVPVSAAGPIERSIAAHAARLASSSALVLPPQSPGVALQWSELAPVVVGHRVTAVLTDGSRITGDALVVRDDALVMDVRRSTGTRAYAAGNAPLNKLSIASLEVQKQGGGRALGIVLGVLAGVVIGGWVSGETADSAAVGIPLFLGIASGITVAGYYAGKAMSTEVTVIKLLP